MLNKKTTAMKWIKIMSKQQQQQQQQTIKLMTSTDKSKDNAKQINR